MKTYRLAKRRWSVRAFECLSNEWKRKAIIAAAGAAAAHQFHRDGDAHRLLQKRLSAAHAQLSTVRT